MEKLIVVGEKFTDFARRHENVLTVNEFERFVWSGELAETTRAYWKLVACDTGCKSLSGSYGSLAYIAWLTTMGPLAANSTV